MYKTTTKNIAFFDAEYTAFSAKDRGMQEMIQCAFIVHQIDLSPSKQLIAMTDEPVFTYNSFIKPIYTPQLSEYIKDLTGITQEDVDAGTSFSSALDQMCAAFKQYQIKHILTWGPDRALLKHNCDIVDCNHKNAKALYRKIIDVSERLSDLAGYDKAISQHKMCQLLNIAETGEWHNAYCDATNLAKIIQSFVNKNNVKEF